LSLALTSNQTRNLLKLFAESLGTFGIAADNMIAKTYGFLAEFQGEVTADFVGVFKAEEFAGIPFGVIGGNGKGDLGVLHCAGNIIYN